MKLVQKILEYKRFQIDDRKQLIKDTMLFLLQRNEARFAKQLSAQLLDEGCNFPTTLAKPRFYELMISGLATRLNTNAKKEFDKRYSHDLSYLNHVQFSETLKYCMSHLKYSEKIMALEVINSIERIIDEWKLKQTFFTGSLKDFNRQLETVVSKFAMASDSCQLSAISIDKIRHRLYIALTTSLHRFSKDQQRFQQEFGSIPDTLNAMQKDHNVFCRVMAFLSTQTPYFLHTASQTFWRTLRSLNTEYSS
jgi:hypothetical protein